MTKTFRRALGAVALSAAIVLATGCHSSAQSSGADPALANMAPANGQQSAQVMGENASYSPQQQGEPYPQQQAAPIEQAYPQQQQPGYYPSDAEQAGEEALEETSEAPPPLPEYDQPPAPGPDYIWTPGYWAWGPYGYYWVPGAWVEAPYYGALWTPPWWGYCGVHWCWHHGYWGPHVGYYGGIDYGFGYIGIGYFGGYWNNDHFYYNRAVTHVGSGIRDVYDRPVVYNNVRYGGQPRDRVSYNGGRGGLTVRPRPTEMAAMRERHDAAMPVQRQMRTQASQNRSMSFNTNHGRPSQAFVANGLRSGRGITAPPRGIESGRTSASPGGQPNRIENRPGQPQPNGAPNRIENRGQPQPNGAPNRFENRGQPQPSNGQPNRFENRPGQPQPNGAPNRIENRGQPQPRVGNRSQPQPQPRMENRPQPQPQPRMGNRPQPQPQPQPRMENRPQPQQRMQSRPQPQPQQRMEAPRQMPQQRAAPPPRPAPAPRATPAPQQPHGGGNGGGHPQGGGDHGDHGHR